ncbi:MAG: stage II sporulation protein M [Spirochaetales bacterium]|nr:stage II sporulation protein M [Spirochaetales bacterium]
MKTLSHNFYLKNRESWERLEDISDRLDRRKGAELTDREVQDFPRLYRKVCSDLAEARLKRLSPDLMTYLNQIVSGAHRILYRERINVRGKRGGAYLADLFRRFLFSSLPAVFRRNLSFVFLSALLFLGSYALSLALVYSDSSLAGIVVSQEVLSMMEESYAESMSEGRGGGISTAMFTYYIQHNISIGFISFAAGILFGLGTVYFLLFNGLQLGAITGYVLSLGYGRNFLIFVTAHSVFELSGLILAGAAGLLLGHTVLSPGIINRRQAIDRKKGELLTLVGAATLLIFSAAIIEGYLSPQPIHYGIKLAVFLFSLSLEFFYLFRHVLRTPEEVV